MGARVLDLLAISTVRMSRGPGGAAKRKQSTSFCPAAISPSTGRPNAITLANKLVLLGSTSLVTGSAESIKKAFRRSILERTGGYMRSSAKASRNAFTARAGSFSCAYSTPRSLKTTGTGASRETASSKATASVWAPTAERSAACWNSRLTSSLWSSLPRKWLYSMSSVAALAMYPGSWRGAGRSRSRHHHPAIPTASASGANHQNRETKPDLRLLLRIRIGVGDPIGTPSAGRQSGRGLNSPLLQSLFYALAAPEVAEKRGESGCMGGARRGSDCRLARPGAREKERRDADAATPQGASLSGGRRDAAAHIPRWPAVRQGPAIATGARRAESPQSENRPGYGAAHSRLRSRRGRPAPRARPGQRALHQPPPPPPGAQPGASRGPAAGWRAGGSGGRGRR